MPEAQEPMSVELSPGEMFGQTLKGRQIAGFKLSERVYPPHFETPKHSHKWSLLCFVIKGTYSETYGAKTRFCGPSTILFHPRGELHAEHFHEKGGHSFIVEIDPKWLDRMGENGAAIDNSTDFPGGVLAGLGGRLYKEFRLMDDFSPLMIEGLMLEIVGEASRTLARSGVSNTPRWLKQAHELLQARFAERLTLDEVARIVQVHPVHLARVFHRHYQCTVGDYIRGLRIGFACHQLQTTDAPLVDIALAAGFCDQSHFTRTFRRQMGLVPSRFREAVR